MDIRISGLSKTYDKRDRVIFRDLNTVFDAGTVSVILGKSGKKAVFSILSPVLTFRIQAAFTLVIHG